MEQIGELIPQKYKHDPDNHIKGDCWAACISTITEIPLDKLPDPNENEDEEWSQYWVRMIKYLEDLGYSLVVENVNQFNYDGYCMAIGKSPRTDKILHAVVWKNGIIHDPHPDKTGIHDIKFFEVITKKSAS